MKRIDWIFVAALIVAFAFTFWAARKCAKYRPVEEPEIRVDTLYVRDTITVTEAVEITKKVVDSVLVPVTDTLRVHDTLFVYLEREQVRWEDELSVVWASGIQPKVDSVQHRIEHIVITKEIPVEVKLRPRWAVGIQAGYGASREGLSPYIGVGVSYNLLSW